MTSGTIRLFAAVLAAGAVLGWSAEPALAQQINKAQHLNNRSQSKVNNVLAKSRLQEDDGSGEKSDGQGGLVSRGKVGCGTVSVGSTPSGQKAPKDVTVVVTGDVINLGSKCR